MQSIPGSIYYLLLYSRSLDHPSGYSAAFPLVLPLAPLQHRPALQHTT